MYEFKNKLEDISFDINKRHSQRTPEHAIDVFMGYKLSNHQEAGLYRIYPDGVSERVVKYDIIGTGEPYVKPFIESLYYRDITLQEMTVVVVYVLGLIDELQLDYTVGGLPQIIWIKNETEGNEHPLLQVYDDGEGGIKEALNKFKVNGKLSNKLRETFNLPVE